MQPQQDGGHAQRVGDTGIWIGDRFSAQDADTVRRLDEGRIRLVVNAARDVRSRLDDADGHEGLMYLRCDMDDEDDLRRHPAVTIALDAMRRTLDAGDHVLVHCAMGANRSSAMVLAYLVLRTGADLQESLRLLRASRSQVSPCHWFLDQIEAMHEPVPGS